MGINVSWTISPSLAGFLIVTAGLAMPQDRPFSSFPGICSNNDHSNGRYDHINREYTSPGRFSFSAKGKNRAELSGLIYLNVA